MANIIEMKNIFKVYPNGVVANENVSFSVKKGEIHALLGENGAGKSTLMKILFGEEDYQEGEIKIKGKVVNFNSSKDAIVEGLGMVYQHFKLIPSFTIGENIILGKEINKNKYFLDREKIKTELEELIKKYKFNLNINDTIENSKVVVKQKVEILKVLYRGAEIIILDEPTAILTPQETEELFVQLKLLKDKGYTIIFITHKLDEVKKICDRLSIMNHGKSMGTYEVENLTVKEISKLMVGRDVLEEYKKQNSNVGDAILKVESLVVKNDIGKNVVDKVSFQVNAGEIVAIVGVEGNGQSELIQGITGLTKIFSGKLYYENKNMNDYNVFQRRKLGIGHIPEDRMSTGMAPNISIEENIISNLVDSEKYNKFGLLNKKNIEKISNEQIKKYQIKCASSKHKVDSLSGGNIQKVVVARELLDNPKLIIANHPTRGIDVGAGEFIKEELIRRRQNGDGVLVVSADLVESLQISDRIIVMYKGKIVGVLNNDKNVNEILLGEYMLGIRNDMEVNIGE